MADEVVIQLSGVQKREVEAALGRELTSVSASGDLFRVPRAVAEQRSNLPPSPPKAEDSNAAKAAAQALPVDVEDLPEGDKASEPLKASDPADGRKKVEVSGAEVQAKR